MSKILVTAAELTAAANQLADMNASFRTKVTEMAGLESELGGMWQGEANNAFRTAFNNDRDQWDTFAGVIDQYVQALNSAAQKYAEAEQTNVETGRNRNS